MNSSVNLTVGKLTPGAAIVPPDESLTGTAIALTPSTASSDAIAKPCSFRSRYHTMLCKWKKYQKSNRPWKNQDMINNMRREFKRHIKWAGIEPTGTLSIHTLRKCCGKNWADHLPPNVTKELMGHSNIQTTMKFYNQVDKDQRKKAANIVDDLINSAKDETNSIDSGKNTLKKVTPK